VPFAACEAIERRVRRGQDRLEFRNRTPAHADRDAAGLQRCAAVEHCCELFQVCGSGVEASVNGRLNRKVVESGSVRRGQALTMAVVKLEVPHAEGAGIGGNAAEPRHFDQLGRGQRTLRGEQRRLAGHDVLGRRKSKTQRRIERVAGDRHESGRPHQRRVEDRVRDERRTTLVARPTPIRADDIVIVDADRNRLRIAESERRGVTTGARVVVVQSEDLVEKQKAPQIGERRVDAATQASFERPFDASGEARLTQDGAEGAVEAVARVIFRPGLPWLDRGASESTAEQAQQHPRHSPRPRSESQNRVHHHRP
jgi:hypothetical protein